TYAAPTATLDGSYTGISATTINGVSVLEIAANLSLPAGVYSLPTDIYVRSGATLTIAAGSVLRGVGTLVIQRGGKLIAAGTATSPIVFTSALDAGSRAAGDNGGIVLLGRARNNNTNGNARVDGFPPGADAAAVYGYGDNGFTQDDQDSSGVLRYVRIEFAGKVLSTGNEVNSLTMGGVGSKTVIDHIQCSWGKDDSYEWFGGTVNAKYLIAYASSDDDFDTDRGFSGKVQFALAVRDASTAESTAGESRGFESDNWVVASQFANPRTTAVFSNVTLVGANLAGTQAGSATNGFGGGMQLRRNTSLRIYNSVVAGFVSLINLADAETNNNYKVLSQDSLLTVENTALIGSTANVFLRNGTNDATVYVAGEIVTARGSKKEVASVNKIVAYPNPARDVVNFALELKNAAQVELVLRNLNGQVVATQTAQLQSGEQTLQQNISNLRKGLYIATVLVDGQVAESFRISVMQ
ncbi:MAG: T9SS type A sorting domain-containing protein, partial [Sphingobacteriia bacterium]